MITVKDAYDKLKEHGQEIELLAGKGGIGNLISWFHIVEGCSIASFVQENEFVIITGIALHENNESLLEIVSTSLANGASCLLINTGPYIKSIDKEIIAFCNENEFPLFVSPWHVYMGEIIKEVVTLVTQNKEKRTNLISAFKNAICFPNQKEIYIPGLRRYDYQEDWHYCISVIKVYNDCDESLKLDELRMLRKNLENKLTFLAPDTVIFRYNDDIVICFANYQENNITLIMEQLVKNISKTMQKKYRLYIGVGRNTLSARCIYKTYGIAYKVANLQRKINRTYHVLSYKDMGISQLFLAMDDYEIMNEYYTNVLKELVNYDLMNNTHYIDFLEVFFECDCHVQLVAKKLFLHRNSVNYKIKKIEDILNVDLNDFQTKASIMVALKLRYLL